VPPRRRVTTEPPRIAAVVLTDLTDAPADELGAGADLDGLAFDDVQVSTLTLSSAVVRECRFRGVVAREADWRSARLHDTTFDRLDVPVVRASRSQWRDVRVEGSRLGSVEAYETSWRSVHLVGCKLGYLNLRGAELLDVALTDCVVEELDLGQADVRRVRLDGTRVATLDVQGATLQHLDLRGADLEELRGLEGLRGATVTPAQLSLLAPLLAGAWGIKVED
jgi:uncharacterized protein YjbI with pentapeptide repeats